jgi:hypothetical protein
MSEMGCGWTHDAEQDTTTQCHDSNSAQRSIRAKERSAFIRTRTVPSSCLIWYRDNAVHCAFAVRPRKQSTVRYATALSSIKVRKNKNKGGIKMSMQVYKPEHHTNSSSIGAAPARPYHWSARLRCCTPAVPSVHPHGVSSRHALSAAAMRHGARVVHFRGPQMPPQILGAVETHQLSLILCARAAHELCGWLVFPYTQSLPLSRSFRHRLRCRRPGAYFG